MPDTVQSVQARIDALKKARDSGVLTIRHGDESTTFRSTDEIMKAITAATADLAALQGLPARVTSYRFVSRKGL